ncbi:MAG TPA: acyclic terpene utilization AtuA family protein [Longimicrobiales bacterium]|nr:acyclic terpene utilization AtuA family protein [Longimicrobiales bacterium]
MKKIRIASGQGFWGDRLSAPVEQVRRGPVDYLMLDYLAEVTMSIMQRQRMRDPAQGYARDFVPLMGEILPDIVKQNIRVIANAGGVNPTACRDGVLEQARAKGFAGRLKVGVVSGDDIMERLEELVRAGHELRNMDDGRPLDDVLGRIQSANAYIGAEPIIEALKREAQVVITGRSTDTALTYAPMMYEFGWRDTDWDRLAAGVVAGHINECGAQATGGNSIVAWEEIDDLGDVGYPIIEAYEDGTFVVTKHDGTGGRVSRAVVAEQILYEMGNPAEYITPDVVADFTTIQLHDEGENRVRVHGVRGGPRTDRLKVSISYSAGWKAAGTLVYGWPDPVKKAEYAARILRERLDRMGAKFDSVRVEYVGWNACHGPLAGPPPADLPEVELRVAVRAQDREAVEMFSRELAPLILTGPPTVTGFAGGRPRVQEIVAYWPALIDRSVIEPELRVDVLEA